MVEQIHVVCIDRRVSRDRQGIDLAAHRVHINDRRSQALKLEGRCLLRQWPQVMEETIIRKAHDILHVKGKDIRYGTGGDQRDQTIAVVRLDAYAFHLYVRIGSLENGNAFSPGLLRGFHPGQIHVLDNVLRATGDCAEDNDQRQDYSDNCTRTSHVIRPPISDSRGSRLDAVLEQTMLFSPDLGLRPLYAPACQPRHAFYTYSGFLLVPLPGQKRATAGWRAMIAHACLPIVAGFGY